MFTLRTGAPSSTSWFSSKNVNSGNPLQVGSSLTRNGQRVEGKETTLLIKRVELHDAEHGEAWHAALAPAAGFSRQIKRFRSLRISSSGQLSSVELSTHRSIVRRIAGY